MSSNSESYPEASGNWNAHWMFQQSTYRNCNTDEVDWAQLAQQWIHMKDTPAGGGGLTAAPPPPPPPPLQPPLPPPLPTDVITNKPPDGQLDMELDDETKDVCASSSAASYGGAVCVDGWQQWAPQAPAVHGGWGWNQYGHQVEAGAAVSNPPLVADSSHVSVDYHHGAHQPYSGYWTDTTQSPFLRRNAGALSNSHSQEVNTAHVAPVIDAMKRRTLPSWIRQGLEKMDEDRRKAAERTAAKEEQLQQRRRHLESQQHPDAAPNASRFDSSSEEDDGDAGTENGHQRPEVQSDIAGDDQSTSAALKSPSEPRHTSVVPIILSEDERQRLMVLMVRRVMTEVLLDVTSSEMSAIAADIVIQGVGKAPVEKTRTVVTHAPPSRGLGLDMYGSDSSESDDDAGKSAETVNRLNGAPSPSPQQTASVKRQDAVGVDAVPVAAVTGVQPAIRPEDSIAGSNADNAEPTAGTLRTPADSITSEVARDTSHHNPPTSVKCSNAGVGVSGRSDNRTVSAPISRSKLRSGSDSSDSRSRSSTRSSRSPPPKSKSHKRRHRSRSSSSSGSGSRRRSSVSKHTSQKRSKRSRSSKDDGRRSCNSKNSDRPSRSSKDRDRHSRSYKGDDRYSRSSKDGDRRSRNSKDSDKRSRSSKDHDRQSRSYKEDERRSKSSKDGDSRSRNPEDTGGRSKSSRNGDSRSRSYKEDDGRSRSYRDRDERSRSSSVRKSRKDRSVSPRSKYDDRSRRTEHRSRTKSQRSTSKHKSHRKYRDSSSDD